MRLPPQLFGDVWFIHSSADDFIGAFPDISEEELRRVTALASVGLPPATSIETVAVLFGYNPGIDVLP